MFDSNYKKGFIDIGLAANLFVMIKFEECSSFRFHYWKEKEKESCRLKTVLGLMEFNRLA